MVTISPGSRWTAWIIISYLALPLGCAASPDPAPGTGGRAAPAAWQHLCEQVWSLPHANALAAARGAEGWELVTLDNGVMCFKRPVPAGALRPRPAMAPGPQPTAGQGMVPVVRDPGF